MSSLPESLLRFRTELEDAVRRELEAQTSARSNGWGARVLRAVRRRPGRTTLAFAAVAGAAAAALFVSGPWKTPPGFLEEVQAALTPEGSILHMKWELTSTSSDLACTTTLGPNEIWIDQTPPQRYRVLLNAPNFGGADLRAIVCSRGTTAELGGTLEPERTRRPPSLEPSQTRQPTLSFVPPNTLSSSYGNPRFYVPDPVADLRKWLSSGRAHDEGTMQLDGRTVRRIRIDPPSDCRFLSCPRKPMYAYVDPESSYPVQIECEDCGVIALPGTPVLRLRMVTRFLTYEPLLPRTPANLALTDIRAQHPDATLSWEPVLHLPKLSGAVAKTVRAAKGAKGARVTFDVTATAGDGGDLPVSCQPRSGSRFPLGRTIVQCGATDAIGSTATAEFTVTVKRRR